MSDSRWIKEGDFSKQLPPEIQANCQYFVKYTKGDLSLSLFKRPTKVDPNKCEYKIQLGTLTPEQVNVAIKSENTTIMNPHRSHGLFNKADAILGEWHNNDSWLIKDIGYIDRLVNLNEIKEEVLMSLEIDEPSLKAKFAVNDAPKKSMV